MMDSKVDSKTNSTVDSKVNSKMDPRANSKMNSKMNSKTWQDVLCSESRTVASLYNRRAGEYDVLVHILSLGLDLHYRRVAVERLHLQPGARVLDLGCGTGLDLPLLARAVGSLGKVVGLDLSRKMLHRARQRIDRNTNREKCSNVSLVLGNALDLPFEDNSFDAIFSDYLLSTVSAARAIDEACRVARKGAHMMFSDDRLPSGWFASPLKTMGEFVRTGYFNCALPGIKLLKSRLSSVEVTIHHGGLIFILSGIFQGP
jgi:demethylmenaquinone methyltransferase/2-methoxy-6-polyprenyl-1,4-benzoquinol methylase